MNKVSEDSELESEEVVSKFVDHRHKHICLLITVFLCVFYGILLAWLLWPPSGRPPFWQSPSVLPNVTRPVSYKMQLLVSMTHDSVTNGFVHSQIDVMFQCTSATSTIFLYSNSFSLFSAFISLNPEQNSTKTIKVVQRLIDPHTRMWALDLDTQLNENENYQMEIWGMGTSIEEESSEMLLYSYLSKFEEPRYGLLLRLGRSLFPCWDVQGFEAPFTLAVIRSISLRSVFPMSSSNNTGTFHSASYFKDIYSVNARRAADNALNRMSLLVTRLPHRTITKDRTQLIVYAHSSQLDTAVDRVVRIDHSQLLANNTECTQTDTTPIC